MIFHTFFKHRDTDVLTLQLNLPGIMIEREYLFCNLPLDICSEENTSFFFYVPQSHTKLLYTGSIHAANYLKKSLSIIKCSFKVTFVICQTT